MILRYEAHAASLYLQRYSSSLTKNRKTPVRQEPKSTHLNRYIYTKLRASASRENLPKELRKDARRFCRLCQAYRGQQIAQDSALRHWSVPWAQAWRQLLAVLQQRRALLLRERYIFSSKLHVLDGLLNRVGATTATLTPLRSSA